MDPKTLGLFVEKEKTLYILVKTTPSNGGIKYIGITEIDRLRKILSVRELDSFKSLDLKNNKFTGQDILAAMPRVMKVSEALSKGYKIVELPATESDARRMAEKDKKIPEKTGTLFGKKS